MGAVSRWRMLVGDDAKEYVILLRKDDRDTAPKRYVCKALPRAKQRAMRLVNAVYTRSEVVVIKPTQVVITYGMALWNPIKKQPVWHTLYTHAEPGMGKLSPYRGNKWYFVHVFRMFWYPGAGICRHMFGPGGFRNRSEYVNLFDSWCPGPPFDLEIDDARVSQYLGMGQVPAFLLRCGLMTHVI